MIRIAKVVVENTTYSFDILFDYIIPDDITNNIVGCKVLVPFGNGNRKRQGIVFSVKDHEDLIESSKLKKISTVLNEAPFLNGEMICLATWMKQMYYCTYFDAVKTIVPTKLGFKIVHYYCINKVPESLDDKFKVITNYLANQKKIVSREKIFKDLKLHPKDQSLEKLVAMGVLIKTDDTIQKSKDSKIKMLEIIGDVSEFKLSQKQKIVYEFILKNRQSSLKEVCYHTGVTQCVVNNLVKKGLLKYFESVVYRTPYGSEDSPITKKDIKLTDQQQQAYESLKKQYDESDGSVSLLYGITGSGKTSVFMKLVDDVHKEGRGVIVMVPEIALTPQIIKLFKVRFGNSIAVFHSGLSTCERLDEWKRVKRGLAKIVVGTRSAVFAPLEDVGLIIIDEEQEYTYKSESSPRFHARDIARFRVKFNGGLLVLSSATPSVETFTYAKSGRYSLNVLTKRYSSSKLPKVTVVDMNTEILNGNISPVSRTLFESLKENLSAGKQSIILLNRRGYNTFASCRSCGDVILCPHCSISMTYHKSNGRLMCHYCGYSKDFTIECPSCHQNDVNFSGYGTQKAEQIIEELLPNARILRMDTDTTMSKFSYEKSFDKFQNGEYDIMIGTQMVAKGLNFPNVTLVAILSADQSLYSDDFRSYERAFSLFTQVIGRSGRGDFEGQAIIQTFTPENPIIKLSSEQNYDKFYESEIQMRRLMIYPPFADIFVIGFIGENQKQTERASLFLKKLIQEQINQYYKSIPIRIIGPSPAFIQKVNNQYRYKLILKIRNSNIFRDMMAKILIAFYSKKEYNKVNIFFDTNPDVIM